jgi:hypothetical protein
VLPLPSSWTAVAPRPRGVALVRPPRTNRVSKTQALQIRTLTGTYIILLIDNSSSKSSTSSSYSTITTITN